MSPRVKPVPAATVMLVRDTDGGPEVYLMRRSLTASFVAGAFVFPGGRLDPQDHDPRWADFGVGLSSPDADQRLGTVTGGLAYWVAALREAFEECGVLLAVDAGGEVLSLADPATAERFLAYRHAVYRHDISFLDLMATEGLRLSFDRVSYLTRRITPDRSPKRFDTRFFLARVPDGQFAVHDDYELIESLWMRPDEALDRGSRGEMLIIEPTRDSLEFLLDGGSVDELLDRSML
ncbi:MAG: NUDIX hydrolase [Acidimicrobiia bacterium]